MIVSTCSTLINGVATGSEKAFRLLFQQYSHQIYSVALTMTKSIPLSEEVVQDVFLKIWLKRESLPGIENFNAYLFTIARNHIYNVLRSKATEPAFVEQLEQLCCSEGVMPDEVFHAKETEQLLEKAVSQLPKQQQNVYRLSRQEGYDYNKIAASLGISRSTVKNHMTAALHHVRRYLHAQHGELILLALILSSYIA